MNASTFASMVVASTLSDLYSSVESGIAALSGPLHGGANEQALYMLESIGHPDQVEEWFKDARACGIKIMGFGHQFTSPMILGQRYKPPCEGDYPKRPELSQLYETAEALEEVVAQSSEPKNVFPNVDLLRSHLQGARIEPRCSPAIRRKPCCRLWACLEYV